MTDQRKKFEEWYEGHCAPAESDWFKHDPDDPDEYFHATTAAAWAAWQAARAQPAVKESLTVAQPAGEAVAHKFFAYDENVGFDLFDTDEEAKEAAGNSIAEYRANAQERWSDEVENVCWGIVLGTTKAVAITDHEGNAEDSNGDRYIDYVLTEYTAPPAQVPDDVIVRYGYQRLFNAIGAATQIQGKQPGQAIAISVLDFASALAAAPQPKGV